MPQGISKNPLTDISKVYLDQVSEARLKSLEKASVLDTSDNPDDQDEARRIRVMHDYADLKKQQKKARKKAVAEEKCDCDCGQDPCIECGESHHKVDEGFSDWRTDLREIVGSASPSTMTGPDKVSQEPGKSLHTTSDRNAQKVTEKKVKNKIKINPEFKEAVEAIGGQLLEVKEVVDPEPEVDGDPVDDKKAEQQKKKEQQLKKRIIRMKMMAVNSGNDQGIVASYDPLEAAVEYFYEEGINEEGLEQLIEDIGLDDFVDFIEGGTVELNEERAARRATVRAKKYDVVKKEVDKADAARKASKKGEYAPSYAKKETDVTVYDDDKPAAKKKAVAKKPVAKKAAPKPAPKKAAPKPVAVKKPVTKKVVKAVAKVKKTQPAKKPSKPGLRDKISTFYKRGVERHKKAREAGRVPEKRAKEFASGVKSGVKTAVKFAKDVKKVVSKEELELLEGRSVFKKAMGKVFNKKQEERKAEKAQDAGARAKRKLARREYASKVSGSEDNVPDDLRDHYEVSEDHYRGTGEKVQKRTLEWMKKKGQKGAPGLDAMKARTAEHKAKRGVKEELVNELKTSTLRSYVNKASVEAVGRGVDAGIKGMTGPKKEMEKNMTKAYKRQRGINTAANKLASRAERNEEVELDELNRYGKETGKATGSLNKRPGSPVKTGGSGDKALQSVQRMIRRDYGRPEGQRKKEKGKKPPVAGEYGARRSPEQIVKKRRWDKERATAAMIDTRGT